MATTSWPTLSASELPSAAVGRPVAVDLDDGEVGQRVDAVDLAGEDAAVQQLDLHRVAALDDVVVGEDPAVGVVDDAGADAGLGDDALVRVDVAGDGDADDGRADLGRDGDGRRRLVDGDRLGGADRLAGGRSTAAGAGWSRAPVALRATTVPPEARTADSSAAARTVGPAPRLGGPLAPGRRSGVGGRCRGRGGTERVVGRDRGRLVPALRRRRPAAVVARPLRSAPRGWGSSARPPDRWRARWRAGRTRGRRGAACARQRPRVAGSRSWWSVFPCGSAAGERPLVSYPCAA